MIGVPIALALRRRTSPTALTVTAARSAVTATSLERSSHEPTTSLVTGDSAIEEPANRRVCACWVATLRTPDTASRVGTGGGSNRLNATPTAAPISVVTTRVSAPIS